MWACVCVRVIAPLPPRSLRTARGAQTVEQHYVFHNLIGKGQFGFVYRATDRRTNIEYAVRAAASSCCCCCPAVLLASS